MPTGVYIRTIEHNNKNSIVNTGHIVTDITKQRISDSNTGKKRSIEFCIKRSEQMNEWYKTHDAPMKGRKLIGKNLDRVRSLQTGVKQSEKTKKKRVETRRRNKFV